MSVALLTALTIFSILVGFLGTQGVLRGVDMLGAALDAKGQVSALQAIAKAGEYTQPAKLDEMQTRLQALDGDLQRIQADLPFESQIEHSSSTGGLIHILRMAILFIHAGEFGVDAGQVMMPHVKGLLSGLGTAPGATPATPALTTDDLRRVQADIDTAGALVALALKERALVHDSDLQRIGLGSAVNALHKLDAVTPKLPVYLNDAHQTMAALPTLLGLTAPATYLLFSQDSDELRPTGGFLGNFAALTFDTGKLAGNIHFQDIYMLDCPNGGYGIAGEGCPYNAIPQRFAWLNDDTRHFGVRDSNLDPDFATSASYIEQNYTLETQRSADGVIAFTPAFIGKVLDTLGGITIAGYNKQVTSANLQDTIHYYHILYAYCNNPNYAGDARCTQSVAGNQSSDKKAFDALLGSSLLHAISAAGTKEQGKVLKVALDSIGTRDLQIFFNNSQVEALLGLFHADNTIPPVQGDQLLVVDTNVGATYANADLKEQIADTVTLNQDGSATHDMTITYTYPYVQHLYSPIYTATTEYFGYHGVALVTVPETSQIYRAQCGGAGAFFEQNFADITEPHRKVWVCQPVTVTCNACNQDGTNNGSPANPAILRFRWNVPNAVTTANGVNTYDLGLIHQAGTHPQMTITIIAPDGKTLSASADGPAMAKQNNGLQYANSALTLDVPIAVSYKS